MKLTSELKTEFGQHMYDLMVKLFPICRSITGDGVRETFQTLQEILPLTVFEVPTGTKVFDWEVPREWNIRDAYVIDPDGNKILDFKKNNLHVLGYSIPVQQEMSLSELQDHLYSLPEQPNAIPYVTSYYKERWGFSISHDERMSLKEGTYKVFIDSDLKDGHLTYAELIIPGQTKEEVFFSTYVCHPSMANNELSGPVLQTYLAKWLMSAPRKYTYRLVFIPETIGSITYLSRNLSVMKERMIAGFNISCVGDNRAYSYLPSRNGGTLADRVALKILRDYQPDFVQYSYLQRGSDERQYCSPGVDLPVASIMRTKYGCYPEYHTSLDNLDLVSVEGLDGCLDIYQKSVTLIERNATYKVKCLGEPQLGKRGLYPTISTKESGKLVRDMMNLIAYADGTKDIIEISDIIKSPLEKIYLIIDQMLENNLFEEI